MSNQAPGLAPRIQNIAFPTATSVTFDLQGFLDGIRAHGLQFTHYRAMRDPSGLIDKYDARRPNPVNPHAINGMHYTRGGIITALLLGNTKECKASDAGMVDSSTCQVTPLSTYEDTGKRVFLAPSDRLILNSDSALVSRHEVLESSPTGIDRPKFVPTEILDCVDSNGLVYHQGDDFDVTDGLIIWKGARRPGQQVDSGRGTIYSIRYIYKPSWYIVRMIHEIRTVQQDNYLTGERFMAQAPQSALAQREFVYESEASDSGTRMSGEAPADGQIPAR